MEDKHLFMNNLYSGCISTVDVEDDLSSVIRQMAAPNDVCLYIGGVEMFC